jgi:hypothetical protein
VLKHFGIANCCLQLEVEMVGVLWDGLGLFGLFGLFALEDPAAIPQALVSAFWLFYNA